MFALIDKFVYFIYLPSEAFKWWRGSGIVVGWFIAANKMYCPRFPILDIGLIGLHFLYWFLLDFMEFYSRQDGKPEEAYMAIKQMIASRRYWIGFWKKKKQMICATLKSYDIMCLNCVRSGN